VIGVTAQDQTAMTASGCGNIPAIQAGTLASRSAVNIVNSTIAINGSQNQNNTGSGNLFNGWELGAKLTTARARRTAFLSP
jgi:hypothetical protein